SAVRALNACSADRAPLSISPLCPLREAHGLFRGLEQGAGFVLALELLGGGIAVGHDAGAGLHIGHAVFDERRAQHDAAVHLAVGGEIAHAAPIGPAL